ncbi:UDP-3-O-(3-hydroxymyristoyl)glucosamine N-acyltransferase [Sporomusa acidovorans]|uniref:UDP-3-O-acylglucosamine N-acyltransferase n=1 Tax=Sporomusa acidovorans (strain ATCC 49682 / DSM 3132 / Mol) TaxID=1123286 RepID=A0ABZ3J746_SPOA4|nr:UDP-3-O-(3-hydroxymyristoyl)glucosamine N-acyltransferase [Sporomusa acidovorans]OZC19288.1 UDP-3-O-acylglucosamine N-acyltransferase [Sporomusa acidovorans DSM 3132]SDD81853.1 UDP-3-O-[3-hydroxymyristoyl] glucosamine N-acyltransferase [Sporomusa acidovorans]
MKKTLAEIAAIVNGTVMGDAAQEITGITNIDDATAGDITFAVPPHLEKAAKCAAAAVIIPDTIEDFPKAAIRVTNPRVAFTTLLTLFTPKLAINPGVHPAAVIGSQVKLGTNVTIMAHAVIDDHAQIGNNTIIYPHTYIGQKATVGDDALLYPNVTIRENCHLGNRVIVHSGAVIGSDGFGFVTIDGRHEKVPQVGNVIVEDDVEIGANSCLDRATTGSTIVKRGTKIDNLVHLAHNVVVGENCYFVAQTGIAGSAKIGNNVTFAGQSGSAGHITIGDNCVFAARTAPINNVPANSFYAGFPARPHLEWLRSEAAIGRLPELIKKIRSLERRLSELEGK